MDVVKPANYNHTIVPRALDSTVQLIFKVFVFQSTSPFSVISFLVYNFPQDKD